jgi:hydrogenase-4 component F
VLGALWHVVHNGLVKGVLFLSVGNLHRACGTKRADELQGVLRRVPFSGSMLLVGFLAITGSPPFAPFASEFQILCAAFAADRPWTGVVYLVALFVVFLAMGATVIGLSLGEPPPREGTRFFRFRDEWGTAWPILAFLLLVVLLGVWNPPPLERLMNEAALYLEPSR